MTPYAPATSSSPSQLDHSSLHTPGRVIQARTADVDRATVAASSFPHAEDEPAAATCSPGDHEQRPHQHDHVAGEPAVEPWPRPGPVAWLALRTIRGYQRFLSPGLPPACRFFPTCSDYGYEAIAKYGIIRGGRLAAWRLLRCNPFGRGGFDPVA